MMSLSKPSLIQVVKKQYAYKLKSYAPFFLTLIVLQLVAALFSFNGVGMEGMSGDGLDLEIHHYSADFVVIFTMIWAFITSIQITSKVHRDDDYMFIANRKSSNFSNTLFLLTASFICGLTAILSTYLIKTMMYYFNSQHYISTSNILTAPADFFLGIFSTSLYVFLFCALGYFVGTIAQVHKLFVVLIPVVFIGTLILSARSGKATIFYFIFAETSITLFLVKILCLVMILFSSAFVISNRMEVKQ
ncbi:MAG TPA: hypothetical protein VJ558_04435 [Bacillales bacterium]|nr:hypothetical protein [Bacillales bacterium]